MLTLTGHIYIYRSCRDAYINRTYIYIDHVDAYISRTYIYIDHVEMLTLTVGP